MIRRKELQLLRAMYQHPTVTAAAQSVHMSQPAASALLRALEERLGFDLFTRENRRLALTSRGRALLPEVLNATAALDAVDRLSADIRHGTRTRLVVGAVAIAASSVLPAALAQLQRHHPRIAITMRAGTALEILDMAFDQRVDLGVIIGQPDERVAAQHMAPLSLCAVLHPSHPLASRSTITMDDLVDQALIVLGIALPAGLATARLLESMPARMVPSFEVMQSSAACALVAAGAGVAIVESLGAHYATRQGLIVHPLMPAESLSLNVVWPKGRELSEVAQHLVTLLQTEVAGAFGSAPGGTNAT